ncbi:uncharacterized protein DNG_03594 [Cephalotrichum gorgonifer]|uniref:Uncharacterized protein n=1 Tax=Cephalotrichum gorgonifer TaxID=2041049 RepID=A0AAE8MWX0_9PEZI|nr:uncharacterized protein DNG_03594 [Cephalotrichum gorgonifer]
MSSRAFQSLRQTPNFVCSQCVLAARRTRVTTPPVRLLAQTTARWKSDLSKAPESATAKPKRKTSYESDLEEARRSLTVRYYEQEPTGEINELESEDAFVRSLDGTTELNKDLEQEYQNIMDIVEGKNANERFRAQFEKEILGAIEEKRRAAEGVKDATEAIEPIPQISEKPFRKESQRRLIRKLNTALERADKSSRRGGVIPKRNLIPLWRAYQAARQTLALSWNSVPQPAWDLLWKLFSYDDPASNPNRLSHVASLAKDLSAANIGLTPAQQVLTIESLFVENWEGDAVKNWKRCLPTLGAEDSSTFQAFWELGVRMFCETGDLDQGNRAAEKLLEHNSDPRILMALIRTYSEQGTEEAHVRAWEIYRRLLSLLGPKMKLEDYDQVISYFLAANQIENALQAFVDMMTSGSRDITRSKTLPPTIGNKFFFGKWLKRLIGAGELDGAHSVVKFMLGKQIQAAPIHINGLIGAWQRSGGVEDLEKADEIAWKMIESRLDFVRERREKAAERDDGPGSSQEPGPAPYPRATLETFSLMAENYRLRQLHEPMMRLWQAFNQAEISHDAFMMNQLLESYLQYGQVEEGSQLYRSLVSEGGVKPNSHTFMVLWKMHAINRSHINPDDLLNEMDNARSIFREMMKFEGVFGGEVDGQLARKILHTFRRLRDNHGFLVALTALRNNLNFLPTELLVLELAVGTTNLVWDNPRSRQRLRTEKKRMDLDIMRRREAVGKGAEEATPEERAQELFEYLVRFYTPQRTEEMEGVFDDERLLEDASRQMGVYDQSRSGQ